MSSANYWNSFVRRRISRRRGLIAGSSMVASAGFLAACGTDDEEPGSSTASGAASGGSSSTPGSSRSTGASGSSETNGLVTKPVDSTSTAKRGGSLPFYATGDVPSFDPSTSNVILNQLSTTVYNRLTGITPGYMEPWVFGISPEVAESWEWSPDRLSLTLKLRPNVKFHNLPPVNGRALDAEDVLFSWKRFSEISPSRSTMANVANPDAPVLDVTATDSTSVTFTLKEPVAYMLAFLANSVSGYLPMLPKESANPTVLDLRQKEIGTGPMMMTNYEPSVGFTLTKNPDFWNPTYPFVDEVKMPILSEYSQAIAQLKAGNILTYVQIRGEDVLPTKSDTPDLLIYESDISMSEQKTSFGWLPAGASPFNDERVRQALSMSYDRDLWIDVFHNVSGYEEQGLPIEVAWNSHVARVTGWSRDPRDAGFGPNAKYFMHNVEEAKKLMAAAGFENGIDFKSSYIGTNQLGSDYQQRIEVLEDMAREVGFRPSANIIDYQTDFIPNYRDSNGQHEGWTYRAGPRPSQDPLHRTEADYYSKAGTNFAGFDVNGTGDGSGDPEVDRMLLAARAILEDDERREVLHQVESYLAQKMYNVRWPGGTNGFVLAWPALQNVNVIRTEYATLAPPTWWLDSTKAPLA
jgi:peptide/nickel transport system substrate-binding protein